MVNPVGGVDAQVIERAFFVEVLLSLSSGVVAQDRF
jgi:hypothetical protein